MRDVPLILVVDDVPDNVQIVQLRLESQSYGVITAGDGAEALEKVRSALPDLILLDVMMPGIDGIETVKRLKADPSLPFIPVILLTARSDTKEVIAGLDSGADDYLTKPFDHGALLARVRAMLRIKALHDTVQDQSRLLEEQAGELASMNRTLEKRVAAQVAELERVGRLKRFLSPQITDVIVAEGQDNALQSHRREVVVLFCDLRGFTAFAETSEPEEVMEALREYHLAIGPLVHRFDGTVGHFAGDGLMVFFNDPIACPDPVARACGLAVAIREALQVVIEFLARPRISARLWHRHCPRICDDGADRVRSAHGLCGDRHCCESCIAPVWRGGRWSDPGHETRGAGREGDRKNRVPRRDGAERFHAGNRYFPCAGDVRHVDHALDE